VSYFNSELESGAKVHFGEGFNAALKGRSSTMGPFHDGAAVEGRSLRFAGQPKAAVPTCSD